MFEKFLKRWTSLFKLNKWKLSILFCLAIICSMTMLICKRDRSFSVRKISSNFEFSDKWVTDAVTGKLHDQLQDIFSEPFVYLASGSQCYAFLSADGNYVLKFFKMKYLTTKKWLRYLPLPGLDSLRFDKVDKRILRRQEVFGSYTMAYQHLRREAGLLFVHFNKSDDLKLEATIMDKRGIKHKIKLDQFAFLVQKKSEHVPDRIAYLMEQGDREGAKNTIRALLNQVVIQCKKGFVDRDSGVGNDYGIVGDQIIHFDVGHLVCDENAKNPAYYRLEVLRVSRKLQQWLKEFYPELLPDLEDAIAANAPEK